MKTSQIRIGAAYLGKDGTSNVTRLVLDTDQSFSGQTIITYETLSTRRANPFNASTLDEFAVWATSEVSYIYKRTAAYKRGHVIKIQEVSS